MVIYMGQAPIKLRQDLFYGLIDTVGRTERTQRTEPLNDLITVCVKSLGKKLFCAYASTTSR